MSKHRHTSELTSSRVPTLKKRSDFLRLRDGKRYSAKTLVLQSSNKPDAAKTSSPRVGYTVTKKVGNAVVRNRIRRRLKEAAARVFDAKARKDSDYVIIGKYGALTANYTSILKDLEQALDHVHGNKAKGFRNLKKSGDAFKSIPAEKQK